MLKQSSLGESAHWALSFAAELRVEARLPAAAYSTDGEEITPIKHSKFFHIFTVNPYQA